MKFKKVKRKRKTLLISFLAMAAIALGIVSYIWFWQRQTNLETTHHLVIGEKNKLQYALDSRILITDVLEANLLSHDGKVTGFEEMASVLYTGDPAIRSIEFAPNGVISYVYPERGNEDAHFDVFSHPEQKAEAIRARDTGQTTLAGPFELMQGGMGLVARNPIFVIDETGRKRFWGFSTVVFNMPEILRVMNLDLLTTQNYEYRLWRNLPDSDEVQVIAENTARSLKGAIRGEINVPNGVWYLDVKPREGWVSLRLMIALVLILTVFVMFTTLLLSAYLTVLDQGDELVHQSNTDALTGIKNSRYLMKRIRTLAETQTPFVLFYLELENFKEIRDRYGRREANKLLMEMAGRVERCIRNTDTVARLDGEEFSLILLADETEEYCAVLRDRLRQGTGQPYSVEDTLFYPQMSVGFARYPADSSQPEQLLSLADQRMHQDEAEMLPGMAEQ